MLNNQSFQFFQKSRERDDLPLVSRTLIINQVIKKKRQSFINLKLTKSKIANNIGHIYKAKSV